MKNTNLQLFEKLILWDISSEPFKYKLIEKPPPITGLPNENCGIHTISVNPLKTLLGMYKELKDDKFVY